MKKRGGYQRAKRQAPKNAAEAAPFVRSFLVDLFDRKEGEAANWQMIAETMFKAGLDAIDLAPDSDRRTLALHRLQTAAYDRVAGNRPDDEPMPPGDAAPAPTAPHAALDIEPSR